MREAVVSIQTSIQFPSKMTAEQKLTVIQDEVNENGGYVSNIVATTTDNGFEYTDEGPILITHRDPTTGGYAGHYSVQKHPAFDHNYHVMQDSATELPGLNLVATTYRANIYYQGAYDRTISGDADGIDFYLDRDRYYVEIFITNIYEETTTTIYYKGVGNGKVAFIGSNGNFQDTPTEELAYYSGKAIGAEIYPGAGAVFKGWYTNPECTVEVTAKDGVWDKTTNTFKPNANILNADSVTFYAKFQSGTIEIRRTNANPGQVFVYYVESADGKIKLYVPLVCDENGNGVAYVLEVPLQKYTVTELEDWSWRHDGTSISKTGTDAQQNIVFEFNSAITDNKWLNGYDDPKENVYN